MSGDKWWVSKEDVTGLIEAKNMLVRENYRLLEEINRLKAGNFTEEEFQNLCHNVSVQEGRCRFEQGCVEYQTKIFGEKLCPKTSTK